MAGSLQMITAKLMFERETKGTFRYQEIDNAGEPVDFGQGKIGTLYLRKSAIEGERPHYIEIKIIPTEIE
jgi:hypothetical protein